MSIKIGTILSMKVGKFVVVPYCTDSEGDSKFFRRKQDIVVVTLTGTTVTLQTAYMLSTEGCKICHAVANSEGSDKVAQGKSDRACQQGEKPKRNSRDPKGGIPRYIEESKKEAQKWYDEVNTIAKKAGVVRLSADTILDVSSVADAIISYAEKNNVDLIIMGTKGRTGLKKVLLGSVASGVISHANCPVLVVR
jgi:nucleotide-binding universal stress UspA family protein